MPPHHPLVNSPDHWRDKLPELKADGHKYDRGHVLVNGSPLEGSGATKLVATAALRSGAGLVTVSCDATALPVYATCLTSVMVRKVEDLQAMEALIAARHMNAAVIGCGNGVSEQTRQRTLSLVKHPRLATVIDADAITAFEEDPALLCDPLHDRVVLTPHEGEFPRLFPDITGERETRAVEAAARSGAIVVLKGQHTLIAAPDGRLVSNQNAPPYLATAGSGDVLAGMVAGLLAQHMPPFEASCAAVYLHGACANRLGFGLIAELLPGQIGRVMDELR